MRKEVEPIAALAEHLRQEVLELHTSMGTKADEVQVIERLEDILAEQSDHKAILNIKADENEVAQRHETHVGETSKTLNGLQEAAEHLSISINSVEEQVAQVAGIASAKAERSDVDEMLRINESVQEQVSALKAELQGTLKALETWILEQNTRKSHGMKLQQKPADKSKAPPPTADTEASIGGLSAESAPPPGPPVGDQQLQQRVSDLENQLAEAMSHIMYARAEQAQQGGGGGMAVVAGMAPGMSGPFSAGFVPPASYALSHGKLDNSGSLVLPAADYAALRESPRGPRAKKAGGAYGATAASLAGQTGKVLPGPAAPEGADAGAGPPFRSQSERRQWLLQEKRRWLVEMRLGKNMTDGLGGPALQGGSSPATLPPLSGRGGGVLSNGMAMDTLATPR